MGAEQPGLSNSVAKQHSHFGKHFHSFLKNETYTFPTTQQPHS